MAKKTRRGRKSKPNYLALMTQAKKAIDQGETFVVQAGKSSNKALRSMGKSTQIVVKKLRRDMDHLYEMWIRDKSRGLELKERAAKMRRKKRH